MTRYILGVDGGTTKTHCALFDTNGRGIDFIKTGCTNYERLAGLFEELEEKLSEIIRQLLSRNKISIDQIAGSVFGLSGVDTRFEKEKISAILGRTGLKDFVLCNDAYLGIKAGSKIGQGICVVNGTGCTVCGIDSKSKMLQIGGQGQITGEPGGGGFLGVCAVQAVYNVLFRGGKDTLMKDMLFGMLGIKSKYDYTDTIRKKMDCGQFRFKDLSKIVFIAANNGDPVALNILEHMGSEIAASVNGAIQELDFDSSVPLDIIMAGSVNIKGENPSAINRLKTEVLAANSNRDIRFTLLDSLAVSGAVIWALQGVNCDNSLYDIVHEQLSCME